MTGAGHPSTDDSLVASRRIRRNLLFSILVASALTLLSTTQPWWTIAVASRTLEVQGTVASPALAPLALTGLALTAALALAGPVFRVILGGLQLALGATVAFASVVSLADPVSASASPITEATGISGADALAQLGAVTTLTAWPWVGVASGVLSAFIGLAVLAFARRWPQATRRYSAVRLQVDPENRDPVVDWDSLSDGDDPTSR